MVAIVPKKTRFVNGEPVYSSQQLVIARQVAAIECNLVQVDAVESNELIKFKIFPRTDPE